MSSSSRTLRAVAVALALALPLAGCTGFVPVYGERGLGTERVEVSYGKPGNRLDQIIYQDLALKLGKSSSPDAPVVRVATSNSSRDLTNNRVTAPNVQKQMTVSATVTVVDADGEIMLSVKRSQSADYTADSQALANQQAEATAARQAALLLSDTIRLEIIAALAK